MSHSPSIGTPLVAKPADHNRASALIFWRIFETVNRVGAFYRYYLERSFRLHWVHFYNFICRNTIFTDNGSFLSYCIRAAIELILTPALLWLCDSDSLELIDFDRNRLYWTVSDLSQSSDCILKIDEILNHGLSLYKAIYEGTEERWFSRYK